jgi:hypothetical protein
MEIAILGIDLGKNSCSLVGFDLVGKVSIRRRMRRETVIAFCAKLPSASSRWKLVVEPIIWGEPWRLRVIRFD